MPLSGSVDDYLDNLPEEFRICLEDLRRTIKVAAPEAAETISYGMPAFKIHGRLLVSYAAFKAHCSLFPMSKKVMETYVEELTPYFSGRGTIRFHPDDPLPATLIEKMIKARIEEIAHRVRAQ